MSGVQVGMGRTEEELEVEAVQLAWRTAVAALEQAVAQRCSVAARLYTKYGPERTYWAEGCEMLVSPTKPRADGTVGFFFAEKERWRKAPQAPKPTTEAGLVVVPARYPPKKAKKRYHKAAVKGRAKASRKAERAKARYRVVQAPGAEAGEQPKGRVVEATAILDGRALAGAGAAHPTEEPGEREDREYMEADAASDLPSNVNTFEERFLTKFERGGEDDCWPWLAQRMPNGYGRLKDELAHRVSWKFFNHQDIPEGMCVLHTCDGGDQGCVNPRHLYLGTRQDNAADMRERGRASHDTGPKLTVEEVAEIRSQLAAGKRQWEIAEQFGVHILTISRIHSGRTWKTSSDDPEAASQAVEMARALASGAKQRPKKRPTGVPEAVAGMIQSSFVAEQMLQARPLSPETEAAMGRIAVDWSDRISSMLGEPEVLSERLQGGPEPEIVPNEPEIEAKSGKIRLPIVRESAPEPRLLQITEPGEPTQGCTSDPEDEDLSYFLDEFGKPGA